MIIKQKKERNFNWSPILWTLPLFIIGLLFFLSRKDNDRPIPLAAVPAGDIIVFENDLEQIAGDYFVADSFLFEGASQRSTTHVYDGKLSIGLTMDHMYGLSTWFVPPSKDATYDLSIRRHNPDSLQSFLVISASDSKKLYVAVGEGIYEDKDSLWETIHAIFQVPPGVDSVKMYCYLASEKSGTVYFDDFRLSISDLGKVAKLGTLPRIDLRVDELGLEKLRQKRSKAWDSGLLVTAEDDWVKAKLLQDGAEHKAKIRLKGDWLDHLEGNQWSFRVKLTGNTSIWGMIELNLQKPDTRGFLREWIYHQILADLDILSPRYRFLLLTLNGEYLGTYACEEHFRKELIESQARRDGPILKFSEDRMWKGVERQFTDVGKNEYPLQNDKEQSFWSAPTEAFGASDYLSGTDSYKNYQRGLTLMKHFKYGTAPLNKIFDEELVGKYLAVVEVCGAYHNLTWHNQRWYYNPMTDKLEPIGFDGYTTDPPKLNPGFTLLAEDAYRNPNEEYEPYKKLFKDAGIAAQYISYLDSLSRKGYLKNFFEVHQSQIDTIAFALQEEYKQIIFNPTEYYDRIARIRLSVPAYPESIECSRISGNQIYVINHHFLPIEIIPGSHSNTINREKLVVFPTRSQHQGQMIPGIPTSSFQDSISFRVLGHEQIISTPVYDMSPIIAYDTILKGMDHPLLLKDGNHYSLSSGSSEVPIIVPEGSSLLIPEGVKIDLIRNAYISIDGILSIEGTEDNPVIIASSDGTGSIAVRYSKSTCNINYAIFDHLGRLDRDGSLLTGGVTFYQSDANLNFCYFKNNTGEDALNIVRSNFLLDGCRFYNTAFDAVDFDFCEGVIKNCFFEKIGNDAIDFSGSVASIENCKLINIGDKGVSVGEHSTVHIYSLDIEKASIGVASKDLSVLLIDQIQLNRVRTGFTAYQKKASFGPATINVDRFEARNVDRIHLIESGSVFHSENAKNSTK